MLNPLLLHPKLLPIILSLSINPSTILCSMDKCRSVEEKKKWQGEKKGRKNKSEGKEENGKWELCINLEEGTWKQITWMETDFLWCFSSKAMSCCELVTRIHIRPLMHGSSGPKCYTPHWWTQNVHFFSLQGSCRHMSMCPYMSPLGPSVLLVACLYWWGLSSSEEVYLP